MGTVERVSKSLTLVFAIGIFAFFSFRASPVQAALHNVGGWAWSGTTGWISTSCDTSGDCNPATGNYGLDVDVNGNLSGWAWSTQAGWICFGVTCNTAAAIAGGVPATGAPNIDRYCRISDGMGGYTYPACASISAVDNALHGWAYIVGETDGSNYRGWVALNCTDSSPNTQSPHSCPSSDFGIHFDEASGNFSGYGWNGNTDQTGNGWVQFACGVSRPCPAGGSGDWGVSTTSVQQTGWTSMDQQEGIYSPPPPGGTPGLYLTSIPIVFRNFSAAADSTLRCYFQMSDGSNRVATWPIPTKQTNVTYSVNYALTGADSALDASGNPVLWSFTTPVGVSPPYGCEIIGIPPVTVANFVAVHPWNWTFTGPGGSPQSDSNRASFCLQGSLGADPSRAYFQNSVQCDVEGDLASSLLRSKGVSVEVLCRDSADEDLNGQTDFAGTCNAVVPAATSDRNCRGITYLCITHTAAPTSRPPSP